MPDILLAVVSILVVTALVWVFNQSKIFYRQICPICAGVLLTWLWLVAAMFLGTNIDPIIPAILMGASMTGIVYSIQDRLKLKTSALLFKATFLLSGLLTIYSLILRQWALFFLGLAATTFIIFLFKQKPGVGRTDDRGCC